MVTVDHDHPELQAASRQARKELEDLRPRFVSGAGTGESLQVKAPFATPGGGNEWMWVEVVRWEGAKIQGVLTNTPFDIPGLVLGARVEVELDSAFDYIHRLPDGEEAGNLTGPVIDRIGRDLRKK